MLVVLLTSAISLSSWKPKSNSLKLVSLSRRRLIFQWKPSLCPDCSHWLVRGSCVGPLGAKVYSMCVYFKARHASLNHGEVICIAIMGIMLLGRLILPRFRLGCITCMYCWSVLTFHRMRFKRVEYLVSLPPVLSFSRAGGHLLVCACIVNSLIRRSHLNYSV